MGKSFRGGQGADQIHMHMAETSGGYRNVLGLHVGVPEYLTLMAGQAGSGHGSHVGGGTFPNKPG